MTVEKALKHIEAQADYFDETAQISKEEGESDWTIGYYNGMSDGLFDAYWTLLKVVNGEDGSSS